MPPSTTSFLFPDINVWLALTCARHAHHQVARDWFDDLPDAVVFGFCRITQLGLLRLLTAEAVMGDETMTQAQAWGIYDAWIGDDRVTFLEEPTALERQFRAKTQLRQAAPKVWADAYLAAFAEAAQYTLVTFDRGFHGRTNRLTLLGE